MTVHHTNTLDITLMPEAEQLWIVCKEPLDPEDFKDGLLKSLDMAKQNNVRQWLIDARRIGELSDTDEQWVQTVFFPQLMQKDSTCFIAMVIAPNCYDRMLQENGWFGLKSYNSFIRINTFYNIQDADNWLRSHSGHAESKDD